MAFLQVSSAPHGVRSVISRSLIVDSVLAGLLIGPPVVPLLAMSGLFPLRFVAGTVYMMGSYVCPQPAMGVPLAGGRIMPVCMRCYGTLLGLLAVRLLYVTAGAVGPWWLARYGWRGAMLMGLLILAYPCE